MSVSEFHHVFTCEQWTRIGALEKASGLTTSSIFTFVLDSLCFFRYFFFIWFSVVFFRSLYSPLAIKLVSFDFGCPIGTTHKHLHQALFEVNKFYAHSSDVANACRITQIHSFIHISMCTCILFDIICIYIVTCKSWCSDGFFSLDSIKMILTNFYLLSFIRV